MSIFNFSVEEILTFFAVLVRYSVLFSILPIFGDRMVPVPVKIFFSLAVTLVLFPGLVKTGVIHPEQAAIWGATTGGIAVTIGSEVLVAVVLGYVSRLLFDAISAGANLAGNFMGFAMASSYDAHQESNTMIVAQIQMAIVTLAFLALDGHHMILRAAMESYHFCGLGQGAITRVLETRLIDLTGQVFAFAIQLAAPVAVVMFAVNVAFGIFSKTLPQMNVLVISLSVSALVGLFVMFLAAPEFQTVATNLLSRTGDWMEGALMAMTGK